jgi:hypothetical protein
MSPKEAVMENIRIFLSAAMTACLSAGAAISINQAIGQSAPAQTPVERGRKQIAPAEGVTPPG